MGLSSFFTVAGRVFNYLTGSDSRLSETRAVECDHLVTDHILSLSDAKASYHLIATPQLYKDRFNLGIEIKGEGLLYAGASIFTRAASPAMLDPYSSDSTSPYATYIRFWSVTGEELEKAINAFNSGDHLMNILPKELKEDKFLAMIMTCEVTKGFEMIQPAEEGNAAKPRDNLSFDHQ